ncbi:hypothetical protein NC653_027622 [Populus alba x Populus x berolinensis]|uniref:Uncharacterized protein n=1 Tax=Populus alba x Populus x berolinensis TaxID=444605 RepID=A0AAD6M6G2_9ROSI|nr:hypothetical protein NC653_027622 [Populus alba x Populus x berolinensis]
MFLFVCSLYFSLQSLLGYLVFSSSFFFFPSLFSPVLPFLSLFLSFVLLPFPFLSLSLSSRSASLFFPLFLSHVP